MIWLALHIFGYLSSGLLAVVAVSVVAEQLTKGKHKNALERIARLEMELGVGLDWGREFFEARKPMKHPKGGRLCWMCKKVYDRPDNYLTYAAMLRTGARPRPPRPTRDKLLGQHLCEACERKTERELSELLSNVSYLARTKSADPENERWMICTRCDAEILVCCFVSDLDPKTYVGWACGCRRPRVPWPEEFKAPRGVGV